LRADDWEPYKPRIIELITDGEKLKDIKGRIEEEFGFIAEYVVLTEGGIGESSRTDTNLNTEYGNTECALANGEWTKT
jgi:hypothetical protein